MSDSFQDALAGLAAIVGDKHVIASGTDQGPYVVDWRGRYHGRAVAVVKPGSTAEVAAIVKFCAARRLAIVPQGGNTGMCGAATPDDHAGNVVGAQPAEAVDLPEVLARRIVAEGAVDHAVQVI